MCKRIVRMPQWQFESGKWGIGASNRPDNMSREDIFVLDENVAQEGLNYRSLLVVAVSDHNNFG